MYQLNHHDASRSDRWLRRHDPRVLLLVYLSLTVWLIAAASVAMLAAAVATVLVAHLIAGGNGWRLARTVLYLSPFALATACLNVLLMPPTGDQTVWLTVLGRALGPDAAVAGMLFGLRMVGLVWAAMLLVALAPPERYAAGAARLARPLAMIGLPVTVAYYLMFFVLRSVPLLLAEARQIRHAQRSRGIVTSGSLRRRVRGALTVAVPVFAAALRRSERLAVSLATRGFDPERPPRAARRLHFGAIDWTALGALGVLWAVWVGFSI